MKKILATGSSVRFGFLNLKLFDEPVLNTTLSNTPGNDLSPEMKTFYSDYLIDNATPNLIHDQFGQQRDIPKNGGKTIEFRKFDPLPKAMVPLQEGVTPKGKPINVTKIEATVSQYGDFVLLSDMLLLTAIDNNLVEMNVQLGAQAGSTLDSVTREVINGGTNVIYAPIVDGSGNETAVTSRASLTKNAKYTVKCSQLAARFLRAQNAKPFGQYFHAVIHPDVAFDLMRDPEWTDAHKYAAVDELFTGEIGRVSGVRYALTTEAKIFHAADLSAAARNLTVASVSSKTFTVSEALSAPEAAALTGRKVLIKAVRYTIVSAAAGAAGAATITVSENVSGSPAGSDVIYPGEAGSTGIDVYSVLVLGQNAFGTTKVTGGGLQNIIKNLGSAGSSDPLDQRATTGWKATKTAVRLVENFMVRVECASTFDSGPN